MPELPEVETIARQLNRVLKGQRIESIKRLHKKSLQGQSLKVKGKKIKRVWRKAKLVIVELEGDLNLLVHLKMTGQLVYDENVQFSKSNFQTERTVGGHPTKDWVGKLPSKHTRVIIELDKGILFFNDMRVFGWVKVASDKRVKSLIEKMPPDVVEKGFSVKYLSEVLSRSRRAVKQVIMDQAKIGGVGNIYACDGLWCAGIDPRKAANKLSEGEIRKLYRCLKKVIEKGIKYGGATYSDYVTARGVGGKYQDHFLVYDRAGERCKRRGCDGKIGKTKIGGRGTYFCKKCQK